MWVRTAEGGWRTSRLVRLEREDEHFDSVCEATITPERYGFRLRWRAAVGVLICAHPLFGSAEEAARHFDRMAKSETKTLRSMRDEFMTRTGTFDSSPTPTADSYMH